MSWPDLANPYHGRDLREDLPERRAREHGGQPGRHRDVPLGDGPGSDIKGWSWLDLVTIGLLLLMLGATVAVLLYLTLGYCACPEVTTA